MAFPKPEDLQNPNTKLDQKTYKEDLTALISHIIELANKISTKEDNDRQELKDNANTWTGSKL